MAENSAVTDEQWKAVRALLKAALLDEVIPVESVKMRPKAVFLKFEADPAMKDILLYTVKKVREKFGRTLRALRKKHANGDLEHEDKPKRIEWSKSAAKQFLKKAFRDKQISPDFESPEQVWNDKCKDQRAFERMAYDDAFIRRLKSVRDDYRKKVSRCAADLQAFTAAKANHPTPLLNSRGEPQWNGSQAQELLKAMVGANDHAGVEPKFLWATSTEYQTYSLQTFRDHIYQEQRLLKFRRFVDGLKQKKIDELQY